MARKRRSFSSEYKERVARMVVDDGLEVSVVCRDQDLGETAVRRWVDQLKAERTGQPGEGRPLTAE
ncbi:transposase, partial [Thioalkalivibrio sp. ALE9]